MGGNGLNIGAKYPEEFEAAEGFGQFRFLFKSKLNLMDNTFSYADCMLISPFGFIDIF
jgi:hypothetical protein